MWTDKTDKKELNEKHTLLLTYKNCNLHSNFIKMLSRVQILKSLEKVNYSLPKA